jgi:hypothetical protein
VAGSDGAAWTATPPRGFACDASITPVVFGEVNPAVLDDLVRLCVQLAGHGHGHGHGRGRGHGTPGGSAAPRTPPPCPALAAPLTQAAPVTLLTPPGPVTPPRPPRTRPPRTRVPPQALQVLLSSPDLLSREALERAIIGKTMFVLLHSMPVA